jgi:hypothetical protein
MADNGGEFVDDAIINVTGAVKWAVKESVNGTVDGAPPRVRARREYPPHPALELYLMVVL